MTMTPGDVLLSMLQARGWTQAQLASEIGYSAKHVNQVIKGKASVGPAFAWHLSRWSGVPTATWLHLQADYDAAWIEAEMTEKRTVLPVSGGIETSNPITTRQRVVVLGLP